MQILYKTHVSVSKLISNVAVRIVWEKPSPQPYASVLDLNVNPMGSTLGVFGG
jgi:hypothetical protein